ncbi:hypothetical protein ACRS0Q_27890 [Pseudomonas aeruginosa]
MGGDDFGEFFDSKDRVFTRTLQSSDDLKLSATSTYLSLAAAESA